VASGVKQGVVAAHLTHLTHHGERSGHTPAEPLRTITGAHRGEQAMVAAHLVDMGHGEGQCGTKRFSHGVRDLRIPLGTCTASNPPSALVAACLEQANGGFYDGDDRPADAPASTITSSGAQQRLITAYAVKYYSSGGQWQGLAEPMHTLPTKGRMGLVEVVQVSVDCLAPEQRARARQCADLLHQHLPEHFPQPAELVLVAMQGQWWALVDITLRMLKPKELFKAQGFPEGYVINEIPNPALLFEDGKQAAHPLQVPRIPLSATAQVRMCGNSVSPPQAEALVRANFGHEAAWMVAA
jgi:DNA (cytosine-5)-methyltransferase 1